MCIADEKFLFDIDERGYHAQESYNQAFALQWDGSSGAVICFNKLGSFDSCLYL